MKKNPGVWTGGISACFSAISCVVSEKDFCLGSQWGRGVGGVVQQLLCNEHYEFLWILLIRLHFGGTEGI